MQAQYTMLPILLHGELAEWLRSGLQIRPHRFDSGTRLQDAELPIKPARSFSLFRIGIDEQMRSDAGKWNSDSKL